MNTSAKNNSEAQRMSSNSLLLSSSWATLTIFPRKVQEYFVFCCTTLYFEISVNYRSAGYSRRVSVCRIPSHYYSGLEVAHFPVLPTVVSVIFGQGTVEKLVVNPNVFSLLPLDQVKVISGSDGWKDNRGDPGPGVSGIDDTAMKIAPVDFEH